MYQLTVKPAPESYSIKKVSHPVLEMPVVAFGLGLLEGVVDSNWDPGVGLLGTRQRMASVIPERKKVSASCPYYRDDRE